MRSSDVPSLVRSVDVCLTMMRTGLSVGGVRLLRTLRFEIWNGTAVVATGGVVGSVEVVEGPS